MNIKILFASVFLMIGTLFFSCQKSIFCAGSYCEAERYKINATDEKIIAAVDTFLIQEPQMIYNMPEGYAGVHGNEYHEYLYYPEKKVIVFFFIRDSEIVFVSQSKPGSTENFIGINNDDVSNKENKAIKKEFETRIVNPIKAIAENL